jgi:hypothetical protein
LWVTPDFARLTQRFIAGHKLAPRPSLYDDPLLRDHPTQAILPSYPTKKLMLKDGVFRTHNL